MGHALRKSSPAKPIHTIEAEVNAPPTPISKTLPKENSHLLACSHASEQVSVVLPEGRSNEPGILLCLTDARARELLRTTWIDDFGQLYDLGTDIYNEIFRLDPSTKKLFKALDGYDLEKDPDALRQCPGFSKQALRFIQTVTMTVKNCSRLWTIDEYLRDIGRRHVQYKHQGFEPQHWHVFETAMTNVIEARAIGNLALDEKDRQILAEAYRELSRHIVASMTAGFRQAEQELKCKS